MCVCNLLCCFRILLFLLLCYTHRYLRRNCPVCEIRVNEVESELDDIQNRLQIDREVVRSLFDRAQEFINLTLFGQ